MASGMAPRAASYSQTAVYGEISIDGPLLAHGQEVCGGDFLVQSGKEYHGTFEEHAKLRHWGDYDTGVHKIIHQLEKIEGKA